MPEGLANALNFFLDEDSQEQHKLLVDLCSQELGQTHLFERWKDARNVSPSLIRQMADQLLQLDKAYPGGLRAYILNAKKLLKGSKEGVNPLDGWKPSIPQGESFELGTSKYKSTEKVGIKQLGSVGFVLVAGGLGERLGYNGTKVSCISVLCVGEFYRHLMSFELDWPTG